LDSEGSLLYAWIIYSHQHGSLSLRGGSKAKSSWRRRTLGGTLAERLVQTVCDLLETGGR
jgi:hypothetical protein